MADMITFTRKAEILINEFNGIRSVLNKHLGKMTKSDMRSLFINDESFSEKSRLLVDDKLDSAFRGYGPNEYQFTYAVTELINVLIINASHGRYKD